MLESIIECMDNSRKTFAKLDIKFDRQYCITCNNNESCHNNVNSLKNGLEYNVHIMADFENNYFVIQAFQNPSTHSEGDIDKKFKSEHEAVDFLCKNFEKFMCL